MAGAERALCHAACRSVHYVAVVKIAAMRMAALANPAQMADMNQAGGRGRLSMIDPLAEAQVAAAHWMVLAP